MKSRLSSFWVTLLILGSPFLMISSVVVAAPTFKIEILPRFAHETFLPISINDYGDIAGVAFGRAAVVSGGNIALVPEVEGIGSPWLALDINDSFVVVGAMHVSSQAYHSSAYVYDGTLRDLGTLGGTSSAANAVNTHGGVVGVSFNLTCPPKSVPRQRNRICATERTRDAQEQVHRRADHWFHQAG